MEGRQKMIQARATRAANTSVSIDIIDELSPADLNDLCDATDAAIEAGGGFGWIAPPAREIMERFWRGVMVVPERHLLLARVDGIVSGAVMLVEPSRHNEAQAFSASLVAAFIAPWARNQGAGRMLTETAEKLAVEMGYKVLQLDVRATQDAAIRLYEKMGYVKWGVNPAYAVVNGETIHGYYYAKTIAP
jgi:ribosomal protein S18 acetylase RimI-like enzyme